MEQAVCEAVAVETPRPISLISREFLGGIPTGGGGDGTAAVVRSNPVKVNQSNSLHFPESATVAVAVRGVPRRTFRQRCVRRDAKHGARDARAPIRFERFLPIRSESNQKLNAVD